MKIVLANGCFDPFPHYGHLLHLEAARAMGDKLVVSVTDDAAVRREKGPQRPATIAEQRGRLLAALRCVDEVLIVPSALTALMRIKPQIFVKGPDYVGRISTGDSAYCAVHGIEIRFTDTPKWSATAMLDELRSR